MALIKCTECGKEISDTIKNCIHCGYENKKNELLSNILVYGFLFSFSIFVFSLDKLAGMVFISGIILIILSNTEFLDYVAKYNNLKKTLN